jgi:hypothetical protein
MYQLHMHAHAIRTPSGRLACQNASRPRSAACGEPASVQTGALARIRCEQDKHSPSRRPTVTAEQGFFICEIVSIEGWRVRGAHAGCCHVRMSPIFA